LWMVDPQLWIIQRLTAEPDEVGLHYCWVYRLITGVPPQYSIRGKNAATGHELSAMFCAIMR